MNFSIKLDLKLIICSNGVWIITKKWIFSPKDMLFYGLWEVHF